MFFFLYPETINYYWTAEDKQLLWNIKSLRAFMRERVQERKDQAAQDVSALDGGDLVSIFLTDPLFKDDIEMILDECLSFFIAGTQTTSSAVGTTVS